MRSPAVSRPSADRTAVVASSRWRACMASSSVDVALGDVVQLGGHEPGLAATELDGGASCDDEQPAEHGAGLPDRRRSLDEAGPHLLDDVVDIGGLPSMTLRFVLHDRPARGDQPVEATRCALDGRGEQDGELVDGDVVRPHRQLLPRASGRARA